MASIGPTFEVTEKLKEFYVKNEAPTEVVLTLLKSVECVDSAPDRFEPVTGFNQILPPNTNSKINFPEDGIFTVMVGGSPIGQVVNYYNLFNSLVMYTGVSLCDGDDGCISNNHCGTVEASTISNALTKVIYYMSVNTPTYEASTLEAMQKIRCSAAGEISYLAKQEKYLGKSDADSISKIELAWFYLGMYKKDTFGKPANEVAELKDIYDYDKISYCIKRLGLIEDCGLPAPPPGDEHEAVLTIAPTTIGKGVGTAVTASYKFIAKDDRFIAVIDTNIPNVNIGKFDGNTYNEIMQNQVATLAYFITYTYERGGVTLQNTVTKTVTAYEPQWFGGESATADFHASGTPTYSIIDNSFVNINVKFQSSSNASTANSGTDNKYIYWITKNAVRFYIGAFEILSGPWDNACDPNSYAIIHKTADITLADGSTSTLHFYRTCPLQDLAGQTIEYTLKQ